MSAVAFSDMVPGRVYAFDAYSPQVRYVARVDEILSTRNDGPGIRSSLWRLPRDKRLQTGTGVFHTIKNVRPWKRKL